MKDSSANNSQSWAKIVCVIIGIIWGVGPFKNARCTRDAQEKTINSYQPSFTGSFSDTEIKKMEETVINC